MDQIVPPSDPDDQHFDAQTIMPTEASGERDLDLLVVGRNGVYSVGPDIPAGMAHSDYVELTRPQASEVVPMVRPRSPLVERRIANPHFPAHLANLPPMPGPQNINSRRSTLGGLAMLVLVSGAVLLGPERNRDNTIYAISDFADWVASFGE